MRRLLPALLLLAACTASPDPDGRPVVAASGHALGWLVGQVGGDGLRVVDAGDPHAPATLSGPAAGADLLVLLPGQTGPAGAEVLDLSGPVGARPPVSGLGDEQGGSDPHVLLDPQRAAAAATALGARLEQLAPGSVARADATVTALQALHARYVDGLAGCTRRTVIASHTAFGALAERYDLLHTGIVGLAPDAPAAPGRLAQVLRLAREDGATTVFVAPGEERLAAPAVEALGAGTATLDPLEAAGGDLVAAADRNLAALRRGLGCA